MITKEQIAIAKMTALLQILPTMAVCRGCGRNSSNRCIKVDNDDVILCKFCYSKFVTIVGDELLKISEESHV